MSGDEPADLRGITGPDSPPPTSADSFTSEEINKARKRSERPSPSDRHANSVALHLSDLRDDRDRLRYQVEKLQAELDVLRSSWAALAESYRSALASNVFSIAMVGLGGSLISGAGYASNPWKGIVLTSGIATFVWGLLLQVTSTWRAALFRSPDVNPPDAPPR